MNARIVSVIGSAVATLVLCLFFSLWQFWEYRVRSERADVRTRIISGEYRDPERSESARRLFSADELNSIIAERDAARAASQ